MPGVKPSGCCQLMPPFGKVGMPELSITSRFNSSGLIPSTLQTNGANNESIKTITDIQAATMPTLLRRKRRQAIWRGLRLVICPALEALPNFLVETISYPSLRHIYYFAVVKVAYLSQINTGSWLEKVRIASQAYLFSSI